MHQLSHTLRSYEFRRKFSIISISKKPPAQIDTYIPMDAEKKPAEAAGSTPPPSEQAVPQDALEKPNEELTSTTGTGALTAAGGSAADGSGKAPKKPGGIKAFLKRFNVYLLLFLLVVVLAAAVSVVSYLNSKKPPKTPGIASQTLTPDTLKQLANSDATVGDSGQTLTVQGNAVFSGQVLVRSDLNVAGTIKLGGTLSVPGLTVSGNTNLDATQINSLQVATGSTFQGVATFQNGINVAGSSAFTGTLTAGQITVTKLILSGNAVLQVPNHLAFTGSSPGRSINGGVLGGGGSASVNGSDTSGTVNVNSGNSPGAGCFVTITFNQKFTNTPHVLVTPIGAAAGQGAWYVNRSTTSFSICTNSPFPGNQTFAYDYFVAG